MIRTSDMNEFLKINLNNESKEDLISEICDILNDEQKKDLLETYGIEVEN